MHCADLGIGADWLGQLMVFMLDWMNGNTRKERINDLWGRIQALYPNYPGGSRLDNLTEKMLSLDKPSPKLKAYAAECRGLVPIMSTLASQLLDATDPHSVQATVLHCTMELSQCYACLSSSTLFRRDLLGQHSKRFCTLWVTLEGLEGGIFRIKPKMHLFQELCEMELPTSPTYTWTYRDEDFGGSLVAMGRRRGGHKGAGTLGRQVLRKFCSRHKLPDLS